VDPNELAVGDRVFCLKKQAYSTYITTPTVFCTRIPDHLSFDEAASMLMPYVTALHGLVNVGRIAKGQVSTNRTIGRLSKLLDNCEGRLN
jgi:NADPH:quinone reductase-like Zn-dependent oxidoreductase